MTPIIMDVCHGISAWLLAMALRKKEVVNEYLNRSKLNELHGNVHMVQGIK